MSVWNGKYISVNVIIEKVYRDMGMIDQLDLGNAVEWIGEAMELIGSPMQLRERIGLVEIKHKKGKLPTDMHLLITSSAAPNTTCDQAKRFIQMRYSTDAYHMFCTECQDGQCNSDITYIINDDYIFVNFDKGVVRLSYKAIPVDENGYPLIPDDIKFKNAVSYHLMWKLAFIKMMNGKIAAGLYDRIVADRDWYIGAAQTRGNMPSVDEMQSIKNNWLRLIKKVDQHSDGFKGMGHQEDRIIHNSIGPVNTGSDLKDSNPPTFFYVDGTDAADLNKDC